MVKKKKNVVYLALATNLSTKHYYMNKTFYSTLFENL